jgi:hypothetical protein
LTKSLKHGIIGDKDGDLMNEYDIIVDEFIWDTRKDESNIKKHGVSFMEARTVFYDTQFRLLNDETHSQDEERFIAIGVSENIRLLMVCHCYKENNLTRIFSAREADKQEKLTYMKG